MRQGAMGWPIDEGSKMPAIALKSWRIAVFAVLTLWTAATTAQTSDIPAEFTDWALSSLYSIDSTNPFSLTGDLSDVRTLIGEARIVGLSESLHSASEPMRFRNDLFRYLVEELNFDAIVIESGLVESKVLNDFAQGGVESLETAVSQGFTHGFDLFKQNTELLRWLRSYNDGVADVADVAEKAGWRNC